MQVDRITKDFQRSILINPHIRIFDDGHEDFGSDDAVGRIHERGSGFHMPLLEMAYC